MDTFSRRTPPTPTHKPAHLTRTRSTRRGDTHGHSKDTHTHPLRASPRSPPAANIARARAGDAHSRLRPPGPLPRADSRQKVSARSPRPVSARAIGPGSGRRRRRRVRAPGPPPGEGAPGVSGSGRRGAAGGGAASGARARAGAGAGAGAAASSPAPPSPSWASGPRGGAPPVWPPYPTGDPPRLGTSGLLLRPLCTRRLPLSLLIASRFFLFIFSPEPLDLVLVMTLPRGLLHLCSRLSGGQFIEPCVYPPHSRLDLNPAWLLHRLYQQTHGGHHSPLSPLQLCHPKLRDSLGFLPSSSVANPVCVPLCEGQ